MRYEPWTSMIVDLSTEQVLGVIDRRDSAGAGA